MIFETHAELKERVEAVTGRRVRGSPRVFENTSSFMEIAAGSVLRLGGTDYYVTGNACEGRFGIVDQPKLWVKYATDLDDGSHKVLKLVFHESFTTTLGVLTLRCARNPDKESRVLELVDGDRRFMRGKTVRDEAGNNVRVLDRIIGDSLFNHVVAMEQSHRAWFDETLPRVLRKLQGCIEALALLHEHGLQHGDVRNDHIMVERETGEYRWIDFDYEVNYLDYDVWSVGNLLTYAVSKGILTCRDARDRLGEQGGADISSDDALLFYPYRLANLKKVFPYVPQDLAELVMRFSAGTTDYYERVTDIARDLSEISLLRK